MKPKHDEATCRTCQEVVALSAYGWNLGDISGALHTTFNNLDAHLKRYAPNLLGKVNR